MEKQENVQVSEEKKEEVQGELIAVAPVKQENWWGKTKRFGKKHKKGLIAGAIGTVAAIVLCAIGCRKEDEPETFDFEGKPEETTETAAEQPTEE